MDPAAHIIVTANTLYARANSTGSTDTATATRPPIYKAIGIILAVCSGLFIGTSFVLKKTGLLKANAKYNEAAGEGYGYLKNGWWWSGMILMIIGEICNFVAYAFVDAILVTPFGALSVVVTTVLSAIFLKERLSFVGKVGCFNCVIGAVVIAINAPAEASAATIQEMKHYVIAPGFLSYAGVVIVGCIFTAFWAGPRYGKKSMFVYLTICSMIGGLSVVATQGLGAAIVTQISGTPQFNQWFLYVLLVFVVCTLVTEIIFLNKALNIFNAAIVTPSYYVYFTSSTIVTSAILFRGFSGTASAITTLVMGFLVICSGVVLLQLAKSSKDVPDTAVFKGDLDQVRTIAEQEEPESEPRADTIRGGAAIVRAISRKRTMRQLDEARTIRSEHMEPIGENDDIYFDGLRRRKTVLAPSQAPRPLQRAKSLHPPLGMSHFPDDVSDAGSDGDVHPGFHLPHFRKKSKRVPSNSTIGNVALTDLHANSDLDPSKTQSTISASLSDPAVAAGNRSREHIYGLPSGLQRTHDGADDHLYDDEIAYKGAAGSSIQWAGSVDSHDRDRERASSRGSSLAPPQPPPHGSGGAKRTFSFQNVFGRHNNKPPGHGMDTDSSRNTSASTTSTAQRPVSRSAYSYSSARPSSSTGLHAPGTEEERLGLVKGNRDSSSPATSNRGTEGYVLPEYSDEDDDEWLVTSGRSSSPEQIIGGGDLGRMGTTVRRMDGRGGGGLFVDDYESDPEGLLARKVTQGI